MGHKAQGIRCKGIADRQIVHRRLQGGRPPASRHHWPGGRAQPQGGPGEGRRPHRCRSAPRPRPPGRAPGATGGADIPGCSGQFFGEYAPERIRQGRMVPRTEHEYRLQALLLPCAQARRGRRSRTSPGTTSSGPWPRSSPFPATGRWPSPHAFSTMVERWEWRPLHSNPTVHIDRSREEPRDRTLSPSEMAALGRAFTEAEERHPATVGALRMPRCPGSGSVRLWACAGRHRRRAGHPDPAEIQNWQAHA